MIDKNNKIQEQLNAFYDIINNDEYHNGNVDNQTLNKLRIIKEKLAKLYNQKSDADDLQANDKINILNIQIKELEFYKNADVDLIDISRLFCDLLNMRILVDNDYLLLDIVNISDEIFDKYELLLNNSALMKIAVKKFPDNKNFKALYNHLNNSESE